MIESSRPVYWDGITEGLEITPLEFVLPLHRLVVHAAGSRDFAPIHHNTDIARAQGAPEAYANNVFLLGMWERVLRDYFGSAAVIVKLGPLRIGKFSTVGTTVQVTGLITRLWQEEGRNLAEVSLRSSTEAGDVVRGSAVLSLPIRPIIGVRDQ